MTTLPPSVRLHHVLRDMVRTLSAHPEWMEQGVAPKWLALLERWMAEMQRHSIVRACYAIERWKEHWPHLPEGTSPITQAGLSLYVAHLQSQGLSPPTIYARLGYVKQMLEAIEAKESTRALLRWMKTCRGDYRYQPRVSRALGIDDIDIMLSAIDMDNPRQVQDAALLLVLYEGPARPHELLGSRRGIAWGVEPVAVSDLTLHPDDTGVLQLATRRASCTHVIHLSPRCGKYLRHWLEMTGIKDGPLFRSFVCSQVDQISIHPLVRKTAGRRLVDWVRRVGLVAEQVSLDSPRMGLATDLFRTAQSTGAILVRTRWGDPSSLLRAVACPSLPQATPVPAPHRAPARSGYRRKPALGSPQQSFAF